MKHNRWFKRILVTVVAAALILGALPANFMKASAKKTETKPDDPSKILQLDGEEPKELSQYPEDVYGKSKEQPFLLSEQNELAFIVSQGWGGINQVDVFDTFNFEMQERDENGNCWTDGINYSKA